MRKVIGLLAVLMMGVGVVDGGPAAWPDEQECAAVAKGMDVGEPGPGWLRESETYGFTPRADDWEALAASKVAFVTHCPQNREFFERGHALGIRAFPYVTFYQGFATLSNEGINLKDHPEFIEVDEKGNKRRTSFWDSEDAKNMYTICPACPEYQDAMCAWVTKLMDLGADGIFLDNLSSRSKCFGAKLGIHKHVSEDPNHAFAILLERVRKIIKDRKPDGAILGNSANPLALPHEYWKWLDADMLESYICTWVSTERWMDWDKHWHAQGVKLEPFIRAGKQIQALSYLGNTHNDVREDAFFCYASARLAGFVWNGGLPISDPRTAVLYQIRMGPPVTGEVHADGVYYRLFERGFVVVNADKTKAATLRLPKEVTCSWLDDLFVHGSKDAKEAMVDLSKGRQVTVPAFSGRAYLYAASSSNELQQNGPTLTIATEPGLGDVRFKVDGFDYWTHAGHWTTKYELGPNFGKFSITFDKPGKHVIEVVDVVPAPMQTPAGYASSAKLGKFMDPSQPTKPAGDRKFKFNEWSGVGASGKGARVEVEVDKGMTVTAKFDVEAGEKK